MAFDYEAVKANIVTWIRSVTNDYLYQGVDGQGAVWWVEDAWDYQVTPYIELTWFDEGRVGRDQVRWDALSGDEDTMVPTMVGARRVRVRAEVRARDNVNVPRIVLEELRTSFDNDVTAATLRSDYGLAPIAIESFEISDFDWEGRRESVGSIELRFGYQTVNTPNVSVPRIRNVGLLNQIRDNAGNIVGENSEVLVGLDYPPGDTPPAIRSAFTTGFSVLAFGAAPASDPSVSPFNPDAFTTGFSGIEE